jgi:di/tricarboxylate transporter
MARTDDTDGRLTLVAWFLVPFTFVLLVLALSLSVDAMISSFAWQVTAPSALCGAAAAVGFGAGELVRWHTERQRRVLRWGYPIAFLVFGIVISGVALPSIVILACTVPSTALLVAGWRPGIKLEDDHPVAGAPQHASSGTISGMIGGPDITGSST